MNGRYDAFSATKSMSSAAPVVRMSVTYIGPAFTAGSGSSTNPTSEMTMSAATMKTTPTSSSRLRLRIDWAPFPGGDVRPRPCPAGCRLFELLRLIVSPF